MTKNKLKINQFSVLYFIISYINIFKHSIVCTKYKCLNVNVQVKNHQTVLTFNYFILIYKPIIWCIITANNIYIYRSKHDMRSNPLYIPVVCESRRTKNSRRLY